MPAIAPVGRPRGPRALRKPEDIAKIPLDKPVLIETAEEEPAEKPEVVAEEQANGAVSVPLETPEVEVEVAEPAKIEEPDLKKQLEDLRRAEENRVQQIANYERQVQEERRLRSEAEQRATQAQTSTEQANYDLIMNAIAASQAEAEAAQRDYETSIGAGDVKTAAEAQRRMARSEARLERYEDAKQAMEAQREQKPQAQQQQAPDQFEVMISRLPDQAKNWARSHKDIWSDQRRLAKLGSLHWEAKDETGEEYTPKYFEIIETGLGLRQKPVAAAPVSESNSGSNVIVAAPVSREAPSANTGRPTSTRVTLSPSQREAAKIAGITEVQYAQQLLKIAEEERSGLRSKEPAR